MAMAPICYKNRTVNNDQDIFRGISPNSIGTFINPNKSMLKCANFPRYISASSSQREKPLESSSREKQLRSLDSYFRKSKNDMNHNISGQSNKQLPLLNIYPVKNIQESQSKAGNQAVTKTESDETSGLYMISTIVSINIAVYLFEIASPIKNSDLELFSLPALYGAKINHLILYGEWWRLLTPMFLHTGIIHIGLGCWALLTFGPKVCRAYGPFTFFLIYILGGLSGNLTSFLHTPDPTVGGTGPVFAIIGAWLIYQYQNKDTIGKDVFESMYQKAIFATAIGFILSTYGPIDDWTHFGSVFTGIGYGFVTCPRLVQIDDSSDNGKDNGMTLISQNVDPCKSLVMFSIFVLVLSCLLIVFEPPLGSLDVDTLV